MAARGAEDVHREANQLCRELGNALDTSIGPAGLDGDARAFNVTERPQSGPKGPEIMEAIGGRGDRQVSDARNLPRLLAFGAENEADSENDRESDQPHGWRGV